MLTYSRWSPNENTSLCYCRTTYKDTEIYYVTECVLICCSKMHLAAIIRISPQHSVPMLFLKTPLHSLEVCLVVFYSLLTLPHSPLYQVGQVWLVNSHLGITSLTLQYSVRWLYTCFYSLSKTFCVWKYYEASTVLGTEMR